MNTITSFLKPFLVVSFFCTLSLQAQFKFYSSTSTPLAAANNIALDANITLNFSDNTKTTSITAANIVVTGRYTGIIAGTFSGGGTTAVVFNPTTNFKPGEVIAVTLRAAVLNSRGAVLTNPTNFSFTTKSALSAFTPSWTENYVADVNQNGYGGEDGTTFSIPADIDGDGDIDIISCNFWNYQITLHKNDGNTNPSFTSTNIGETSVGSKPYALFVADIDGDGDLDLIDGDSGDGFNQTWTIRVYNNFNGDGSSWVGTYITGSRRSPPLYGRSSVFVADMDNDGDMDIIGSGWNSANIVWYENTGDNMSSRVDGVSITNSANQVRSIRSIVAADMDNDGDMDIISAHGDIIAWYENDGHANPSWTKIIIAGTFDTAQAVYAADMDNDGDTDIIAVINNGIVWLENDGSADPTFTAADVETSGPGASQNQMFRDYGPIAISAADINNDGHMDILSAKSWYLNDGNANPSWTAAQFRTGTNNIRSISAADMDGDGDMDILATSYDDSKIYWYENNSTTTTWDGSESNAWATAGNWSHGVPNTNSDVTIANAGTALVLTTATDVIIGSIVIESGASLNIAKGGSLKLSDNFTNSGTVILESDSDEFSSLLVSGTSLGNITYNRYVNMVGTDEWDLIGAPVSGMAFSSLITDTNIAKNGSGVYAVGSYDNTTDTWTNATSATTGNLMLGLGYQMATTSGGTLSFTGSIANGDQSVTVTNNDAVNSGAGRRWNLIANPFASYLNGNSNADGTNNFLTVNTAAIDDEFEAIYGWKADGTGYEIYNHAFNSNSAVYIAPGQGFFVAAAGSGTDQTISFTKAMQTVSGGDDFVAAKTAATSYELVLDMHSDAIKVADTKFYFKEGLTLGLDPGYDAGAFNQSSGFSSRLVEQDNGIGMGINAMSLDAISNAIVPLVVHQEAGITLKIEIANSTIPENINVYLEDTVENTFTLLTNEGFELLAQTTLSGVGRFFIHYTTSTLSTDTVSSTSLLTAYKGKGNAYISVEGLQQFLEPANLTLYNVLGMKVLSREIQDPSQKEMLSTVGMKTGVYILKVQTANIVFTKKLVIE